MIADAIAYAMRGALIMFFLAGAAVATFVIVVIPWLWRLVKPWITPSPDS